MSWKNPKRSGLLLASINLVFFLYWYCDLTMATIFSYVLLFYVLTGIALNKFYLAKPENAE